MVGHRTKCSFNPKVQTQTRSNGESRQDRQAARSAPTLGRDLAEPRRELARVVSNTGYWKVEEMVSKWRLYGHQSSEAHSAIR